VLGEGGSRWRSWRRRATSIEVAAVAGIVSAIAWSVSLRGLLDRPGIDATRDEIARFYTGPDASRGIGVFLALAMIGTVAYLWFVGVVRQRLGRHETRLVATVFLGGSVLLTGLVLVAASMLAAPSLLLEVGGQIPDPGATALLRTAAAVVLSVFTARIATLVMFSTASLGRQTGALPTWLIVVTVVVGLIEFVNVTIAEPSLYLFPAWIALVSVVLFVRRPGEGADAPGAIRP
jgi:hypothetical protein